MAANERTVAVVGLLAYCALVSMTRLAKDGDQTPKMKDAVLHAHMADRAFHGFEALEKYAQKNGFDLVESAGQFSGLFDEMDARTRPSSWWERSLKTYIGFCVVGDVLAEVCEGLDIAERGLYLDFGQQEWEEEHLAPEVAADPQLAARLSLWARRVVGDMLGLMRATLFTYPELGVDADRADEIVHQAEQNHMQRMRDLGLKP